MGEVSPHWQYLKYLVRHKRFVYREGRKLRLGRWQLLVHDISKFLPDEWGPYVNYFYRSPEAKQRWASKGRYADTGDAAFDLAWLKHQKRNRHHYQWWILPQDDGTTKLLEMPCRFRKEMLADWRGAGAALGKPDTAAWYRGQKDNMHLAPETRAWVEEQLGV